MGKATKTLALNLLQALDIKCYDSKMNTKPCDCQKCDCDTSDKCDCSCC